MKIIGIEDTCKYIEDRIGSGFALVCIGTYIRSDDRVALEFCSKILEEISYANVVLCEYGLEMCLHEIIEKKISRMVIIDAVAIPTFVKALILLSLNEIRDYIPLSTHSIPLETILGYLKTFLKDLEIEILGIPVKNLEIGLDMSTEVQEIIDELTKCLK
jgi:hydrogenase maturation protease